MNVKTILAAKQRNLGGDIVSIEPTANLAAAAKLLSAHRIGAVVILGAGARLAGILSERDIVRALSEHGAAALNLSVGQVMTRNVATCTGDEAVASIMPRNCAITSLPHARHSQMNRPNYCWARQCSRSNGRKSAKG